MKLYSILLAAAPIVSVGLYQEDVAVVTRAVTPANNGAIVRVGDHEPFGGSFWHTSKTPLTIRRVRDEREVSVSFQAPAHLRGVIESAKAEGGHRVRIGDAIGEGQNLQIFTVKGRIRGRDCGKITLASGSTIEVQEYCVVSVGGLAAEEGAFGMRWDCCESWEFSGADEPFSVEYLTRGAHWTPSYRLALAGDKATLLMSGTLANNLGDWKDTEVSLISGRCNVAPDAASRSGRGLGRDNRLEEMLCCASADMKLRAADAPSSDGYQAAADDGAGNDVHYRSLGKVTLRRGDALTVPLGAEQTDVKRLVEWTTAGLWDAVRFKNPFKFPMPSARMEVAEDGRILGLPRCEWTNPGDEAFVKIAEANSVKGSFEEQREHKGGKSSFGAAETMRIGERTYAKDKVTALFKVTNFREEAVTLNVRRTFNGELGAITLPPTKTRDLPPKEYGVNLDHEVTWEFELKPGEKREFQVEYVRWVKM